MVTLAAVQEQADVVQIAADATQFVSAIAVALSQAEEFAAERQARAAANTWRQRVEQISDWTIRCAPAIKLVAVDELRQRITTLCDAPRSLKSRTAFCTEVITVRWP